ncbi:MAG TPA: molybdopterin molybdotransferase MoeA, partial [Burkholderiaceae bacterium]
MSEGPPARDERPPIELTLEQAFAEVTRRLRPIDGAQRIAARGAAGRILADEVVSRLDLPGFDNSAMDGYALRACDARDGRVELRVIGQALAGHSFGGEVGPGECVRTMTGAPMPGGADAVVPLEEVDAATGSTIVLSGPVAPGAHRRLRGEHVRAGDAVLHRGRRLRGCDIGLAFGVGADRLTVFRPLRVGVLSTGDELADPPAPLPKGGGYDANRPFLLTSLERHKMTAFDLSICPDDGGAFARAVERAFELDLDILLTTGGAAQGDADVVRRFGGVEFLWLNFRPGRGVAVAELRHAARSLPLIGLPGNAVAAYVMFHLLAMPSLLHLAGARAQPAPHVELPLACDLGSPPDRIDYRRA